MLRSSKQDVCAIEAPQSICILRLSAIGDVCHAVATVQAIQNHYPAAKITWILGKVEAMLLQGLPGVNFVIFDKKKGLQAYRDLQRNLQGQQFDVLLHMQVALRANLASLVIKAKRKIGFDKARAKELHSFFMRDSIAPQENAHVLEGFAAFARKIGVPFLQDAADKPQWQMPITQQDLEWAKATLQPYRTDTSRGFLVISPAASKAERNWLAERYAAVADYATELGFKVVLCGGPTEMEQQLAANIVQHSQASLVNLVSKTSLKQLLAVLQQAAVVIAPDTGPAHMAVTVGTPVIGLYAHSNPARTGPYLYQEYVVEVYHQALLQQTGKTAAEQKFGKRVKGADLMANIQIEQVKTMLDTVIKQQGI
ncbi:glycosyltransferase family 9 protein [Rheinheimera sp. MMS21-TC3]|uniref:glycosyltransferase family 9 protein n=1 Tax=Rheinheimera sp. MMS21-TC3 TaxID=3072790 RepID=UPI0028C4C7E3|nr:glycosyltransferase family 9 protein [Rheinheimera sp. MMS21-TC3]WNO60619.1 glycosyltransferase family 9 protein [Rheinheimera sp. MMS21-TC3]